MSTRRPSRTPKNAVRYSGGQSLYGLRIRKVFSSNTKERAAARQRLQRFMLSQGSQAKHRARRAEHRGEQP